MILQSYILFFNYIRILSFFLFFYFFNVSLLLYLYNEFFLSRIWGTVSLCSLLVVSWTCSLRKSAASPLSVFQKLHSVADTFGLHHKVAFWFARRVYISGKHYKLFVVRRGESVVYKGTAHKVAYQSPQTTCFDAVATI